MLALSLVATGLTLAEREGVGRGRTPLGAAAGGTGLMAGRF